MVVATTSVAFIAGAFASWGPKFVAVGLVAEFGEEASVDLDTSDDSSIFQNFSCSFEY